MRVGHNFLGSRSHPCRAPRFLLDRIFSSKKLLTSMISNAPGASLPSYSTYLLLLRSQLILLQKSSKRLCLALDWKHLFPKGERKLMPYRNAGTGEPWNSIELNILGKRWVLCNAVWILLCFKGLTRGLPWQKSVPLALAYAHFRHMTWACSSLTWAPYFASFSLLYHIRLRSFL